MFKDKDVYIDEIFKMNKYEYLTLKRVEFLYQLIYDILNMDHLSSDNKVEIVRGMIRSNHVNEK